MSIFTNNWSKNMPKWMFIVHLWFSKWNKFQIDKRFKMAIVWLQLIFYETNTIWTQWFIVNSYMHLWSRKNYVKVLSLTCMKMYKKKISRSQFTLFCCPNTFGMNTNNAQKMKRSDLIAATNCSHGLQKTNWPVSHIRAHKIAFYQSKNGWKTQVQSM